MHSALLLSCGLFLGQADTLKPGMHSRSVEHEGMKRSFLVHVPKKYDASKPTPVVLVLHGATMNGQLMVWFSGFEETGDKHTFISVFPSGNLTTWNAGAFPGVLFKKQVDDVGFLNKVLDDVEKTLNVDKKRVYATGMSNGGMMSYRLASEMSERIVAIAPVAGTLALEKIESKRPVPVLHFHGKADYLVPYGGPASDPKEKLLLFKSVPESLQPFLELNGCTAKPETSDVPSKDPKLKITRTHHAGKDGNDVILYTIAGGGHTWPGRETNPAFLGPTALDLDANEIIWEFFKKYSLK